MDASVLDHAYLTDLDFHSPSPSSAQLNISPAQSPFDSFDFIPAPFPHTPSYNGSYNNSPYSGHSDLSFGPDADFGLFDEEPQGLTIQDYDPADYDPQSSSLLMFGDGQYVTSYDSPAGPSYDYSSPSSNGGGDSGPEGRHSRGSSVASSHHHPSPRLDVSNTFEGLSVRSPYWGTAPLPHPQSPPHKPQSPPQLVIPDASSPVRPVFPPPPTINAPDGDGHAGPQLHIVPATPVSGGTGAAQAPFHQRLETLPQGASLAPQPAWPAQYDSFNFPNAPQTQYSGSAQQYGGSTQQYGGNAQQYGGYPADAGSADFLLPAAPRTRSKSDTARDPPTWDYPAPRDDGAVHEFRMPTLPHPSSFGPPSSTAATATPGAALDRFLSPDTPPPGAIRRSKSDAVRPGHRASRSEDLRLGGLLSPPAADALLLPGASAGRGHHRRASSGSRGLRASPYPSPSASPRGGARDLPELAAGVSKPNVTTGRTANASHARRKQEATFMCPVPGCGSTFTRSFNLKGHIRSHNEERPFACHWPGCGKGFARQHDCKRHEQLHTNFRPFTCSGGCGKQFARMDALNRHLRSEGGTECARVLEAAGGTIGAVDGDGGGMEGLAAMTGAELAGALALEEWGDGGTGVTL